jgi:DUF917 family protein
LFSIEDKDAIDNLVVGTTILGTGGGGGPETGRKTLENDLNAGRRLQVIDLDEIPDDALIVSPYFIGSIAPGVKANRTVAISDPFAVALESVERHFKRKVAATVASELGGGNTAAALHVASQLNIPLVDGDLLGRAGPELHQSTAHIFDTSMAPSVVVSETGNLVFIERYAHIDDYEALARYVAVISGGHAAVIDTPLTKSEALRVVIRGTISKSMTIGKAVREANRNGADPVDALRKTLGGWLIFTGTVEKYEWKNEKGFLFAEVSLNGQEKWHGRRFRSWIKNEHILAWLDNKPIVMPPDLIMFLDKNGFGVTNDTLRKRLEVSVIAAKAPDVWRTPKGLACFGPKHFGFDYEYIPVEKLVTPK